MPIAHLDRAARRVDDRRGRWRIALASLLTTAALAVGLAVPAHADPLPGGSSVTGDWKVGGTVTYTASDWDPNVQFTYQWWQSTVPLDQQDIDTDAAPIDGATASSIDLTADQLGLYVWVEFTTTLNDEPFVTGTTGGRTLIAPGVFTDVAVPTLSGVVAVDSPVTVDPGTWPEGTTFAYEWRIEDSKGAITISKVKEQTYSPTGSTAGKKLSAVVVASVPGYEPVVTQSAAVTIASGVFATKPTPTITGRAQVGQTLTAVAGAWSPTASLTYSWKRNGASIPGATASTYKLTAADGGAKISVAVAGRRTGYVTVVRYSASTETVKRIFAAWYAPTISGTPLAGTTLTATIRAWSPTPTFTYQWRRDGVDIPGATAKTFKLSSRDVGSKITVVVTGSRTGYASRTAGSAATTAVKPPVSILRDGSFAVGTQIAAGTYVSSKGATCNYAREDRSGEIVGWAYGYEYRLAGQKIITISSRDAWFHTEGCGTWTKLTTSIRTAVKDGTYAVGSQMQTGRWVTWTGSDDCYLYYLRSFTGDPEIDIMDGWQGFAGPLEVTIPKTYGGETVKGVLTYGCGVWERQ